MKCLHEWIDWFELDTGMLEGECRQCGFLFYAWDISEAQALAKQVYDESKEREQAAKDFDEEGNSSEETLL